MQFDTNQHEHHPNATSPNWLAPLTLLVAWLVSLLQQIARLKRIRATTVFKLHWTQSWDDLRRLEWHRDQMLAQGAALLLSGKTLNDADAVLTDPPADYGGPRPTTPFQMQRRFLAIADFLKDPEGHIRRHAARIARHSNVSFCPLRRASRATSPSRSATEGGNTAVCLPRAQRGGGGMRALARMSEGAVSTRPNARGPPLPTAHCRLPIAALATPAGSHPLACRPDFRSTGDGGHNELLIRHSRPGAPRHPRGDARRRQGARAQLWR